MKFSKNKKLKMRKKRQRHIAREFNGYFWIGHECPSYKFLQEEERQKNYIIISKMISNDNYYLLLINEDTNEICIAKLVYSGYVQITKLSSKKVLENKSTFKSWLKDMNHEANKYKYMIKYVLTEDGKIELRNTDYREGHNRICVSIQLKRIWKCFEY